MKLRRGHGAGKYFILAQFKERRRYGMEWESGVLDMYAGRKCCFLLTTRDCTCIITGMGHWGFSFFFSPRDFPSDTPFSRLLQGLV